MQRLLSFVKQYRLFILGLIIALTTFDSALAYSSFWTDHFDGSGMGGWRAYLIGSCSGQNHSVSGSSLHMRASYGTNCFGAYYRDEYNGSPGTFPKDKDVRVTWRWRYPLWGKYGSEAGQVTSAYGVVQYYGVSGVNSGGNTRWAHVEANGDFGHWDLDNPIWQTPDLSTNWYVSTFDFICDGTVMDWWVDGNNIKHVGNGTYRAPNDPYRPSQFWMGNLITNVSSDGNWTQFDLDYVYIYAVERPQMNGVSGGSGGTQTVTWNAVPNTQQPDGATWSVQYQARACTTSNCSSVQAASPWVDGLSYAFTGLPLNKTYYYQVRAKWVGTPPLETCWSNQTSSYMAGAPDLRLSKTASMAQQEPGGPVIYTLTLANVGDAPANNVFIVDPRPSYILNPTNITNAGFYSNGEVRWNLGTLAPGASITVSWEGTVDPSIPRSVTKIVNTANAFDDAGHTSNAQATTTILYPDMELSKIATNPVYPSADIDFTITVRDTGQGHMHNIVIRDPIPSYVLNPRNISDNGTVAGNEIVWNLGSMGPGESNILAWRGTVDPNIPSNQTQLPNTVYGSASSGISKSATWISQVLYPDMALTKTAPAQVWPGGTFGYTITVTSNGQTALLNTVITDTIPAYVTDITNISNGGQVIGDKIVWNLGSLSIGSVRNLTWKFKLSPDIPGSQTKLVNNVQGTAVAVNKTASAESQILYPVMRLTKAAPTQIWPNLDFIYTITVENIGDAPMYQAVISDTIPHYIIDISGVSHQGQKGADSITWTIDQIQPGGRVDLTWHGRVDPNIPTYETEIVNNVTGQAIHANDSTSATSDLVYADMGLVKFALPTASPGEIIDYTIVVRNTGDAPMYEVLVVDTIPNYIEDIELDSGTQAGSNITWMFDEMAPGEIQTLTWRGVVAPDIPETETMIINRVRGSAIGGINKYSEALTTLRYPRMSLNKTASPQVWPGGEIAYNITAQNAGSAPMLNVVIKDRIPDYVLNPVNISGGGYIDGRDIVWELGDMVPGASFELSWDATVDAKIPMSRSVIRNQVQGTADRGIEDFAEANSLVLFPSLVVQKTGTPEAAPGDQVQYVITVQNASAAPVSGITLTDTVPEFINDPTNITGGGRLEGNQIIWELGDLAGGETRSLIWEGTIDLAVPMGKKYLDNTVNVCDESKRFCDQALYRMRLLQPDARVIKNAEPYGWPSSDVYYTILVQNTGETVLENVVVTDPLPDHVLYPREITHGGNAVAWPFEGKIAVVWDLGNLKPGDVVELAWMGTIDKATPVNVNAIENKVTLTDKRGLKREGSGSTYVMHPELRVLKRATEYAQPGGVINYSLTIENPSWVPAFEVEVHDLIPTYLLTPTNVSNGGEVWADEVYWFLEKLAPGQVITLTWQGTVDTAIPATETQIVNTVNLKDLTGITAQGEAMTDLVGQEVSIHKSAPYSVYPGSEVFYRLDVENHSAAPVADITVRDLVPAYVIEPRDISSGGIFDGNVEIVWQIPSLAPGQKVAFTWRGTVDRRMPATEQTLWNQAHISSQSGITGTAQARSFVNHPALNVDKLATVEAGPGGLITYTIEVANVGQGPTYDIEVHDPIPPYLSVADASGAVVQADAVSWGFRGEFAAGEKRTLSWVGRVNQSIPPTETVIASIVTVSDAAGNMAQDQAVTSLLQQQVYMSKDASYAVYPGFGIVYTVTVQNPGLASLYDLVVRDPIPANVLSPTGISAGGDLEGNSEIVWRIDQLLPGQQVVLNWTGMVDMAIPSTEQTLWNEARLMTGSGLTASAMAKSLVHYPILAITKEATVHAGPGDGLDYVIKLHNLGQSPAYRVEITDRIPAYVINPGSSIGEIRADEIYWYFDQVNPGETTTLDWFGVVDPVIPATETTITNTVVVVDAAGNTDTAQAVTDLARQALAVVNYATYDVFPGSTAAYTVTLANRGETALYNVVVKNTVPAHVINPTNISSGGILQGNTNVVWEVPALAAGQVMTLTWEGRVDPTTPATIQDILNEVQVATESGLSDSASAKSFVHHPILAIGKTATVEAGPGQQVEYTLMVGNTSLATAYNVEVHDPIPPYILSAGGAVDGEVRANEVYWHFDQLSPGEVKTLNWSGLVDPEVPESETTIVNTATVVDGAGNTDMAQAVTNLPGQKVYLAKAATFSIYPGGEVEYAITVQNRGSATLSGLVIRDPIPTYVADPRDISAGGYLDGNIAAVWEIPSLAPGLILQLTWKGTVVPTIPSNEPVIWNEVELTTASGLKATAIAKSWVSHPILDVAKMATVESGPGSLVDYMIVVRNSGAVPAYNVEVHDLLPAYITNPSGVVDGEVRADEIVWRFDQLPAGETRTMTWSGLIDGSVPPDLKEIVNTVSVRDGAGNSDEAQAITRLIPQQLYLAKNASYDVYPGGTVVYTITIQNRGNAALFGVVVRDPLPEYVVDPDNISGGGFFDGNTTVAWEIPVIGIGETLQLSWHALIDPAIPPKEQSIWNEAQLTTAGGLKLVSQAKSIVHHPDLTVTKRATVEAGPGGQIDYTIVVENPSDAPAYHVELHDPIPNYIISPSGAPDGEILADEIYWRFDALADGESRTVTWSGLVDPAIPESETEIVNTVMVRDIAGNTDESRAVTNIMGQRADLLATASYEVYPGSVVVYTMTVRNRGNSTLQGIVVTDPVPQYVLSPSQISAGGRFDGNSAVIWEIPGLNPGETLQLSWVGLVDRQTPSTVQVIWNEASLTSASGLKASAKARSFVHSPAVTVDKEATLEAGPGQAVQYSITIKNPSHAMAYGVEVHDPIPAYIVNPGNITGGAQLRANEIVWLFDQLAPGEGKTLTWSGQVDASTPNGQTQIVNRVTIRDMAGNTSEAQAVTNLTGQRIDMVSTASYEVYPGGPVVYTITVRNRGDAALTNVTVRNEVPDDVMSPGDINHGGILNGNTEVVWEIPNIAVGERITLTWAATVDPAIATKEQSIWNEVELTSGSGLAASARARSLVYHPLLTIDKTTTLEAGPGEPVRYTIVVRNPSLATAYEVEIHDPIPPYIVKASSATGGGQIRADEVLWRFDQMRAGEVVTVTWDAQIDPAIPATEAEVVNVATVTDVTKKTDQAQAVTNLLAHRVDMFKTASYLIYPGGPVVYTITVRNRGDVTLSDLVIRDLLPDYILNPSDINHDGLLDGNTVVVWEVAALAPRTSVQLTWRGTLDPRIPTDEVEIFNEAKLTTASGLTAMAKAKSTIMRPQLVMVKLAPTSTGPANVISYTLIVENVGGVTAPDVLVQDPIPAYVLEPRRLSSGGVLDYVPSPNVRWRLGDLAPGERRTMTWEGTIDPRIPTTTMTITNTATVRESGGNSATAQAKTHVLMPQAEMVKSATVEVGPGERITYTLAVSNTGPVPLQGITVTDPIPAYILNPSNINYDGSVMGDKVVWTLNGLNPGEMIRLVWNGLVDVNIPDEIHQIEGEAKLQIPPSTTISAKAVTWVLRPSVAISKTAATEANLGDPLNYTIVATNTGKVSLFGVIVTDPLPSHVLTPTAISGGGVISGNTLTWNLGQLTPGQVVQLTWSGQVAANTPATVRQVRNEVSLTAQARVKSSATAITTLRQPDIRLNVLAPENVQPGDLVDYELEVTNIGQAVARSVMIQNPVPAYVTPLQIGGNGYEAPGRIVWSIGDLEPGQKKTLSWRAGIGTDIPISQETVTNIARVSAAGGLTGEGRAVSRLRIPQLVLRHFASTSSYPGGEITYTLRLENVGMGLARNIELRNPVPENMVYVPGSATGYGQLVESSQVVTWAKDVLKSGEKWEVSWRGQVAINLPGTVKQIASEAVASTPDLTHTVTATAFTSIVEPNVSALVICPPQAQAGDVLSYTVRLHNTGGTLSAPTLRLTIPEEVTYVAGSASHVGKLVTGRKDEWGSPLPDELAWSLPTLATDSREQITFALQVAPYRTANVQAAVVLRSLTGKELSSGACETVLLEPLLNLEKTGPVQAVVNDRAWYEMAVTNTGLVVAHNAVLTDSVLPGINYLPGTASEGVKVVTVEGPGDQWEKTLLVWSLGDLAPGEKVSRRFQGQIYIPASTEAYSVNFSEAGEAEVVNEAQVSADRSLTAYDQVTTLVPRPLLALSRQTMVNSGGAVVTYNTASVQVEQSGPLQTLNQTITTQGATATVNSVPIWPGSIVTYTLVGANSGPGVARSAILTDHVPENLIVLEDSVSDKGYYDANRHAVIWGLGDLSAGRQVTRSYAAMVPVTLRPGAQQLEKNLGEFNALDSATVYANATLELSGTFKIAAVKQGPLQAKPGNNLDYVIQVRNISPNPIDQVIIRDPLPEYTSYVTDSASEPPAFELGGKTLVWNLGLLLAGEIREVRFKLKLDPATPDLYIRIINKADIAFAGGGSTTVEAMTRLPMPASSGDGSNDNNDNSSGGGGGGGGSAGGVQPTPLPAATGSTSLIAPPLYTDTLTNTQALTPALGGHVAPGAATPTPLPVPALGLVVSPETVKAGNVSLVTWRLTFTNPTPLTISQLAVRDLLPDGLLYIGGETSHGIVEISPRSADGRDMRFVFPHQMLPNPTQTPTPALIPTRFQPNQNVMDLNEAMKLATPWATGGAIATPVLPVGVPIISLATQPVAMATKVTTPTTQALHLTPTMTPTLERNLVVTSAYASQNLSTEFLAALPKVEDVPMTEVVFKIGDVPPGGRVEMLINTLVLSDVVAGTSFGNIATFSAANLDPGTSNKEVVQIEGQKASILSAILPVTGGLLELVDPRTPSGQVSWIVMTIVAMGAGTWWLRYKRLKK